MSVDRSASRGNFEITLCLLMLSHLFYFSTSIVVDKTLRVLMIVASVRSFE